MSMNLQALGGGAGQLGGKVPMEGATTKAAAAAASTGRSTTTMTTRWRQRGRSIRTWGGVFAVFLYSTLTTLYSVSHTTKTITATTSSTTSCWTPSSLLSGYLPDANHWGMLETVLPPPASSSSSLSSPTASATASGTKETSKEDDEVPFEWDDNSEYGRYCHIVEDVCRTSHRWFYRPTSSGPSSTTTTSSPPKRQPNLVWGVAPPIYYPPGAGTLYKHFYRFEHLVVRNASTSAAAVPWTSCATSVAENHLVIFARYSDMLSEFYDRLLVPLDRMSDKFRWVRTAQLYLHLEVPYKPLMDSHHLFSAPLRTRPLMSAVDLLDDPSCLCLPRLILCGYDAENTTEPPPTPTAIAAAAAAAAAAGASEPLPSTVRPSSPTRGENTTTLVLRPGDEWVEMQDESYKNFRAVRERLRSYLIDNNPHVRADAATYRDQVLEELEVPPADRPYYKLVALTQRVGRRRWLDLPEIMESVRRELRAAGRHIALIEMNLEVDSSSYQQVVRHAALDGLIGIHGAQLTEALWMNDSSWLVELLPFSPDYVIMGPWTRTVASPTPIGKIMLGTQLNHAGYRLPVESAPYCDGNITDRDCWENNLWDGRNFVTGDSLIREILETFFPDPAAHKPPDSTHATAVSDPPLCSDYRNRSGDRFVLYNVNCADEPDGPVTVRSYFWKKD